MKKGIVRAIWAAVILAGGTLAYKHFVPGTKVSTGTTINGSVMLGTIQKTIKTTGVTSLANQQQLKFAQEGKVTNVNIKVGQTIKQGQVLAQVDDSDANISLQQQQLALAALNISLQKAQLPATQSALISAQNDVSNAQAAIKIDQDQISSQNVEKQGKITDAQNAISQAQQQYQNLLIESANKNKDFENQIAVQKSNIDSLSGQIVLANSELNTLKQQQSQNISVSDVTNSSALTNAISDSKKYLIDINSSLDKVDQIFGFTTKYDNNVKSYINYVGLKDNGIFTTQAKTLFLQIGNDLQAAQNFSDSLGTNPTKDQVIQLLNKISPIYNELMQLGDVSSRSMQDSLSNNALTDSMISSFYNTLYGLVSSAKSSYQSITSTITNLTTVSDPSLQQQSNNDTLNTKQLALTNLQAQYTQAQGTLLTLQNNYNLSKDTYAANIKQSQDNITSKQNALALVQKTYDTSSQQLQNTLQKDQNSLKLAQQKYQETLAGSTPQDIALAKNNIQKQQLSIESAKKAIEKYQIVAPFDGTVTYSSISTGDVIASSDSTKYITIENPNLMQIKAQIDESDIINVKVGQSVSIQIDSISGKTFTGQVASIDTTPITTSGVTTYAVYIVFDKGSEKILGGMSSVLNIIIQEKSNIAILKSEFIQGSGNRNYVLQQNGTQTKRTPITIGLTDNKNTEIVSGLSVGDKVIRQIQASVATSSKSSTRSSSGFGAAGGTFGAAGGAGGGNFRPGN